MQRGTIGNEGHFLFHSYGVSFRCFLLSVCCSAEGRQQLLWERQQMEARLAQAAVAARETEIAKQKLREAEAQRDALRVQTEVRLPLSLFV